MSYRAFSNLSYSYLNLPKHVIFARVMISSIHDTDRSRPSGLGRLYGSPQYALASSAGITAPL